MENGGLAAIGVFRKHMQKNARPVRFPTIIKTREEIDAEEAAAQEMATAEEEEIVVPKKEAISVD